MNKTIVNPIIKDEVTFIKTAQTTNGKISTLAVKLMPNGGTPMHYHKNFDETFIVTNGELTLHLKSEKITLQQGQRFTVKRGKSHRFANESAVPVFFTTLIEPGSVGFENALAIMYGLAEDGHTNNKGIPQSLFHLAVISKMSDMHQAGPMILLAPILALFNQIARLRKIDQQLLHKYGLNQS